MATHNANIVKLTALWQGWSGRFAALQPREKNMIIGAVAVAILFGGFSLWIEPGQLQATRLKKTIAQQQGELEQILPQVAALQANSQDPDAGNRVLLGQLREQLAQAEQTLKTFDASLMPPAQAPALLQSLLARHRGLALVSLTTLPPQPLIDPPAKKPAKEGEKTGATKEDAPPPMPGGNIYKHGIEIKVAGAYLDLLAYVAELEASSQKLIWGGMQLAVRKYPVSELTLTLYTLSLDAAWLIV